MKTVKLTETKNEELVDTKNEKLEDVKSKSKSENQNETKSKATSENQNENQNETKSKSKSENQSENQGENQGESKKNPKKGELTNREYSTLLEASFENKIDFDDLKTEAIKRLKDVISAAYSDIKRLHESKTQVSDFIRMSRAEQSNKVLQISSGSLEQRLGYDRETYTSVTAPKTPDEAVIYTLLACIGWDATARLCGISDTPTAKKSKSDKGSNVVLNF